MKFITKTLTKSQAINQIIGGQKSYYHKNVHTKTAEKSLKELLKERSSVAVASLFLSFDCDYDFNDTTHPEADWKYISSNGKYIAFGKWE